MQYQEKDKNTLLIVLVVVIFIILLIAWRTFLKFTPVRTEQKNDSIFSELINQGESIKTEIEQSIPQLINVQLPAPENLEPEKASPELTNEEVKKIEEKILEHLNQKNSD